MTQLMTLPITAIDPGERFRQDFGDLEALAESIKANGLISPIAVEERPGSPYLLLAGERRLRAAQLAGFTTLPARIYPAGTGELRRRQVEAAENFDRMEMDWKERAALVAEIHRLHQELHGPAMQGSGGGWGLVNTAQLINASHPTVSQELRLHEAVQETPELFTGCRTKADAIKVMRRAEEAVLVSELAERAKQRTTKPVILQQLHDSYITSDVFDLLRNTPSNTINWVELDPDFGIDIKSMRGAVSHDDDYVQVSGNTFPTFFMRVLHELQRVMTQHGHVICWYGFEWTGFIISAFKEAGFTVSHTPGVWLKDRVSGVQNQPYMNFDPQTELFLVARKGSPSFAHPGRSNVFEYPRLGINKKIHPFERPLDLMRDILRTVAFPGSRGLVPFLGSGKTLVAAHHLGMGAFGCDISPQYRENYIAALERGGEEWCLPNTAM